MMAAVLESVHSAFWDWGRNHPNKEGRESNKVISFIYRVHNYCETESSWPWVHNNSILSYLYASAPPSDVNNHSTHNSPVKTAYSPLKTSAQDSLDVSLSGFVSDHNGVTQSQGDEKTIFFLICCNIWRFFPDITSIGIGFLMSTLGDLNNENIKFILWFVIVPSAFIILILVSMLQKGSARYNFSRFFLECSPVTTLGYTSYAMYLFQRAAFCVYLPFIYFGLTTGIYDLWVGNPDHWFEHRSDLTKFLAVLFLTFVSYLVHKYFQDRFVTYWYARLMSKMSTP